MVLRQCYAGKYVRQHTQGALAARVRKRFRGATTEYGRLIRATN